jgi:plasmid maintenance system antidote protein VapI
MSHANEQASPGFLLNQLIAHSGLKNDAALARKLQVAPPVISKIRNRRLPLGDGMLLNMHETFGIPVADLRALGDIPRTRGMNAPGLIQAAS